MKTYYAGFDLASRSVAFTVLGRKGSKRRRGTLKWNKKEWKALVEEYSGARLIVAFEASPEATRAQRILRELGVETYCFHPAHFKDITQSKKKTDARDADRMARALRGDCLPPAIYLPDDEETHLRNLVSEREFLLKVGLQCVNRLKGMARQHGITLPRYSRDRTEEWWMQSAKRFRVAERPAIERLARIALAIYQCLDELQEEMDRDMEKAGYNDKVRQLQTIPGIGPITARALALYLGRTCRFNDGRRFGSYLGLVPSVDATGHQTTKLGHITKEGPPALRRLLVQAANAAVQSRAFARSHLDAWFRRLVKRRGRKIAIVALARKLAVVAYALHRDDTTWDPEVWGAPAG